MTHILRYVQYPLDLQSTYNGSVTNNTTRIEGVDRGKIGKISKEFSCGMGGGISGSVGGIVVGSVGGSATTARPSGAAATAADVDAATAVAPMAGTPKAAGLMTKLSAARLMFIVIIDIELSAK